MFCSNCGNPVQEGQAVCLKCGFALKTNTKAKSSDYEVNDSDAVGSFSVARFLPAFKDTVYDRKEYFIGSLKVFVATFVLLLVPGMVAAIAGEVAFVLALPVLLWAMVQTIALYIGRARSIGLFSPTALGLSVVALVLPFIGWLVFLAAFLVPPNSIEEHLK